MQRILFFLKTFSGDTFREATQTKSVFCATIAKFQQNKKHEQTKHKTGNTTEQRKTFPDRCSDCFFFFKSLN